MRIETSMELVQPAIANARAEGLLVIGFSAWTVAPETADVPLDREHPAPLTSRAWWSDQRVTVRELASAEAALEALARELDADQLADVPRGPDDLGVISFVHPDGVSPAVFFVRGNMLVTISSPESDVLPLAYRIDAELRESPKEAREAGVELQLRPEAAQTAIGIKTRWRFDDGYIKVLAPGVELAKVGSEVVAKGKGELAVFVVEKQREIYFATAALGTL